ncbi:hypothetical protein Tco_0520937 [Tanacetum coccineum]
MALNECPKKSVSDVVLNNPRQATRGVPVGPKVSFKSTKQIYRPISNKNSGNTSGKKKQAKVSRENISNSNPFDALNSIEYDDDLDKIDKLERQTLDGKLMFVDDDGNLLVPTGNVDSDNDVEVVFDETTKLMASTSFKSGSDRCYGGNNVEANDSASRQAQQAKPAVSQDGLGVALMPNAYGSGVGSVIGLFATGRQHGHVGVGVASQSSSPTRWTKRRVPTKRLSPQKRTSTQPASQPSTHSQVQVI